MNNKTPLSLTLFLLISSLFIPALHAQWLPNSVIEEMSSREMRYKHFLWHTIRNEWNTYDQDTQQYIRDLGWAPPRPARDYVNGNIVAISDNNSGEDFLYMHRQMIRDVQQILWDNNDDYDLTGWEYIPEPGDNDWPVPDQYQVSGSSSMSNTISNTKTNNFYYNQILPMEDTFMDEDTLRSMTLGEMGSRIEFTIHNWLHLRFSSESYVGYRPGSSGPFPYIDERWDDPSYDWLGDTYSSHVNPVFWKLHGWVDDRIEDWRRANGLDEINWRGTWLGGPIETISGMLGIGQQGGGGGQPEGPSLYEEDFGEGEQGVQSAEAVRNEPMSVTLANESNQGGSLAPQSSFADDVQIDFQPMGKAVGAHIPKLSRSEKKKGN